MSELIDYNGLERKLSELLLAFMREERLDGLELGFSSLDPTGTSAIAEVKFARRAR